jgi:uncharacterized cupin superfamily protein
MTAIRTIRPAALVWEAFELDPHDIRSGYPAAEIARTYRSPDERVEVGIWRAGVGAFSYNAHEDGILYLLEGRLTVRPQGAEPVEAEPGDFIRIPPHIPFVFDVRKQALLIYTLDKP